MTAVSLCTCTRVETLSAFATDWGQRLVAGVAVGEGLGGEAARPRTERRKTIA